MKQNGCVATYQGHTLAAISNLSYIFCQNKPELYGSKQRYCSTYEPCINTLYTFPLIVHHREQNNGGTSKEQNQ